MGAMTKVKLCLPVESVSPSFTMWYLSVSDGAEKVLADQMPDGSFTVSPTDDYLIFTITEEGKPSKKGLKLMNEPDDRMPGWRNRVALWHYDLRTVFCICHKQRSKPNEIEKMILIGDVKDRDVILVDDIIDTAGTITRAGQLLKDNGARSVRAMATHPILSGSAMERLDNSVFDEVVVTDTIPLHNPSSKIRVISTAELLAEVIKRVENYESLSELFNKTK